MEAIGRILERLRTDRRGVTALEYALVAALIGLAIVGALMGFTTRFKAVLVFLTGEIGSA